jgi:hypothetical protein
VATLDDGMAVAAGFFALGIAILFAGQLLLLAVSWTRRLLG